MIQTDFHKGNVRPFWYPKRSFKTFILGRNPSTLGFQPEPQEAVHWAMPDLSTKFSRRIIAFFCDHTGSLTIVRLSTKNPVHISSDVDKTGKSLRVGQRYTVSKDEIWNLKITINGDVIFKTQAVSITGNQKPRIESLIRQS